MVLVDRLQPLKELAYNLVHLRTSSVCCRAGELPHLCRTPLESAVTQRSSGFFAM